MILLEYFLDNQDRLMIHKPTCYFEVYERYFQKYINTNIKVLEIGIGQGGSLKMWKEYFGTGCQIVGIDINAKCLKFKEPGINIYTGDQADVIFLSNVIKAEFAFDIIIDDGGHSMNQQITSFSFLFQFLNEGGIYLCEDVGTSYRKEYRDCDDTFIEMAKRQVDKVNNIDSLTKAIYFHDSMVLFEKGRKEQHDTLAIGKATI